MKHTLSQSVDTTENSLLSIAEREDEENIWNVWEMRLEDFRLYAFAFPVFEEEGRWVDGLLK